MAPQLYEALFQMTAEEKREGFSSKMWPLSLERNAAAPAETKMNLDPNASSFLWVGLHHDLDDSVEMAVAEG